MQRYSIPVIASVGVVVNCLSMVVLTRKRMRSSTNCYLTALAFFDALYLVFNFSMSLIHHEGFIDSKSYNDYIPWGFPLTDLCSNTSVWLIVSFTVERCIAVCYPLRGSQMCTIKRAKIVISSVFAVALACSLPTFFEWRSGPYVDERDNVTVYGFHPTELGINQTFQNGFYWFTSLMFSLIPIMMLIIFNSILVRSVHHSQRQRRKMTTKVRGVSDNQQHQELRITIMLIVVVVVFLICQLPSAVLLIWSKDIPWHTAKDNFSKGLNNISNLLMATNATCNFFLYCFLSDKFRRTFVQIFYPCRKAGSPLHMTTISNADKVGGTGNGERYCSASVPLTSATQNRNFRSSPQPPKKNNYYQLRNVSQPNGKPNPTF